MKWILANPSQLSQSTPQPNKQEQSSESDESDESSESKELSQEITSPAKPPSLGNVDHVDKKFMLQHCKGYGNWNQFS